MKKTMAMGLYYRFNFPRTKDSDGNQIFEKSTELFIKQLPLEFEDFVANVLQKKFGGDSLLASRSSQFGIDFEHHTDEGLFLGQAKVLSHDLPFETIAILHSNIVKRNAEGGYLVTTGGFTRAAKEYAEGLNIQLIDGVKLVEYWLESMNHQIYVKEQKIVSGEYV
ncbi:restriction endonuclease [Bacillus sp. AGMB 02131]|uniref:Restriction endonuclease n=1 Tax=Peribacillus faecalis TaxID=2772559 RepID=A0A927HB59_9BACI|nr:restriction endonuclease [Peribacillus faecalis]